MRVSIGIAIALLATTLAGCGNNRMTEAQVEEFLQHIADASDDFDTRAACEIYDADAFVETTGRDENGEIQTATLSTDELCRMTASAMSMWKKMGAESNSTMSPSLVRVAEDGQSAAVEGTHSQSLRVEGESVTVHTRFRGMLVLRDGKILISNWVSREI